MRNQIIVLSLLIIFIWSLPLLADYKDAYSRKDYLTAYGEAIVLAKEGDREAQLYVGLMYGEGRGVPVDYNQAVQWYRKSAEQGLSKSQYFLGWMYKLWCVIRCRWVVCPI